MCETRRRFGTECFEVCYSVLHWGGWANEKGLKLNETLEILFFANDVNLMGENKHTVCEGNVRRVLFVASN